MNLNGIWYNELGSSMELTVTGKEVTGIYRTAVGNAAGQYSLTGKTDDDGDSSQSVGFVVLWSNEYSSSDSITAWSGQAQTINEEEIIVTTWLLTAETDPNDDWHSTIIGKDVFTRFQISPAHIKNKKAKGVKLPFPSSLVNE